MGNDRPKSLELFAGAGGLALGLHGAGFEHKALVEFDGRACDTLRHNAEVWPPGSQRCAWRADQIHEQDVRTFLKSDASRSFEGIDLLAAGPPCQPFSLAGVHAGDSDSRNMFPVALEAVRILRPKVLVFENVPGLLRPDFLSYFEYVQAQLERISIKPLADERWEDHAARITSARAENLDYRVRRQVLNAADYGVPQVRKRVFLMAVRADICESVPPCLEPTHSENALFFEQWISGNYWREHALESPASAPSKIERRRTEMAASSHLKRWRTVRDAISDLPEPSENGSHPTITNHKAIPGARVYPGHTGSELDRPSKTIKAGVHGVCGGEAVVRLDDDNVRYLTVREAARIQSFPDYYEFLGARSHAMRHIGNAVPVDVATIIGRHLRRLLDSEDHGAS